MSDETAHHASEPSPGAMAWIHGGAFAMGSADYYPEERPVREVTVDGFWIDRHPVTVAEFAGQARPHRRAAREDH